MNRTPKPLSWFNIIHVESQKNSSWNTAYVNINLFCKNKTERRKREALKCYFSKFFFSLKKKMGIIKKVVKHAVRENSALANGR